MSKKQTKKKAEPAIKEVVEKKNNIEEEKLWKNPRLMES